MREFKNKLVTVQTVSDDVAVVCLAIRRSKGGGAEVSQIVSATGAQALYTIGDLAGFMAKIAKETAEKELTEMFGKAAPVLVEDALSTLKGNALEVVRKGLDGELYDVEVEL